MIKYVFHCRLLHFVILTCVLVFIAPALTQAGQYVIEDRLGITTSLPGIFGCLYNPNGGQTYYGDAGDGGQYMAFEAVLDTGSSGNILSATDATNLNIPITGESYFDVGIGGLEEFDVSEPTGLKLASMSIWDPEGLVDHTENPDNYPTSHGIYQFQNRKPETGSVLSIMGTPLLNQYVMHVMPNSTPYWSLITGINYLETELLSSLPSGLSSTGSELVLVHESGGVLHVPLNYQNFIEGSPPVSTSTNPLVDGVQVFHNGLSATGNWLFDTGAMLTIIGEDIAVRLGITTGVDPLAVIEIGGIGSATVTFYGYQVDSLTIPVIGEDELIFQDVMVFATNDMSLPAELPGVLGMNLFGQSYDPNDVWSMFDPTLSVFSDWYVVPAPVPEPGTFVLLAFGASIFLLRRIVRRRRA